MKIIHVTICFDITPGCFYLFYCMFSGWTLANEIHFCKFIWQLTLTTYFDFYLFISKVNVSYIVKLWWNIHYFVLNIDHIWLCTLQCTWVFFVKTWDLRVSIGNYDSMIAYKQFNKLYVCKYFELTLQTYITNRIYTAQLVFTVEVAKQFQYFLFCVIQIP